ncbi:MAG: carbohydrate kinase family protein [Deinococcota bacterium]
MTSPIIVAVGSANVDILATVPHLPVEGERLTATDFLTIPGGMAANCACAAARVGANVIFFGRTSSDALSNILTTDFERHGVNMLGLNRDAPHTTLNLITTAVSGERSIIAEPNIHHPDKLMDYLQGHQPVLVYVDGYHLGVIQAELAYAEAQNVICFCDLDGAVNSYPSNEVLGMLEHLNIILWNPPISQVLFPELSPVDASKYLADKYALRVILTQAANDVVLIADEKVKTFVVPPQPNLVDTTGAGDTFAGVFMHAYTQTGLLEQAVRRAIDAASLSVNYYGARGGLDRLEPF